MTKKLESKELTTIDEMASFWDRFGHAGYGETIKKAEKLGVGVRVDEYTDKTVVRFDGTVAAGSQHVVKHNFEQRLADPKNWTD